MPVTQIVEFPGSTGLAAGANAYLFAQGSDTVVATASAVAERTNAKGIYQATFADVAAGDYLLVAKDASSNPICVDPLNGLTLEDATFQTASIATAANEIAAALLDLANGIETGITLRQSLRAILAALCGKITNAGSNPELYKNPDGTADRISVANDASGNRTAVTLTL